MMLPFDTETTTCVFTHPKLQGVYYSTDVPTGFTENLAQASKFMGAKSRNRGLKDLQEKFPQIKEGEILFFYLNS